MVLSYSYDLEDSFFEDESDSIILALKDRKHSLSLDTSLNSWQRLQIINTDIALQTPTDYFLPFIYEAYEMSRRIQVAIAEKDMGSKISWAMANVDDINVLNMVYEDISELIYNVLKDSVYSDVKKEIVRQFVVSELIGLSVVDFLYRDKKVREIFVNTPSDVQVEIKGVIHKVPSVSFKHKDHLKGFIERIYAPLNKTLSRMTPQVKGRLKDFSRVYCVDESVSPRSRTMNIRKHDGEYVTPDRFLDWGSVSKEMLTFLGNLIYNGANYVVVGGTGSGKTTLLSSLTGFIRPNLRVMTLEDSLEMVPCPNKLLGPALECVPPRVGVDGDMGVTMRDLVKGSLQMRPDWIIVGEVTDGAAYDMVQALSTGHSGGSTLHSFSAHSALSRLVSMVSQGGVMRGSHEALPIVADAVDVIVTVERFPSDGSRKITGIWEVDPFPIRNGHGELELPITPLWLFTDAFVDDNGSVVGQWVQQNDVSQYLRDKLHLDFVQPLDWEQLQELATVPV